MAAGWIPLGCDLDCCPPESGSGGSGSGGGTVDVPCCEDRLLPETLYVTYPVRFPGPPVVPYVFPITWNPTGGAGGGGWGDGEFFRPPDDPDYCIRVIIWCDGLGIWQGVYQLWGGPGDPDCTAIFNDAILQLQVATCDPLFLDYNLEGTGGAVSLTITE